jgi:hypothetical protein
MVKFLSFFIFFNEKGIVMSQVVMGYPNNELNIRNDYFKKFITNGTIFKTEKEQRFYNLVSQQALKLFSSGHLVFFDAMTHNNQCHLLALRITELYQKHKNFSNLTIEEKQFITSSFLITSCFNRNKKLMRDLFAKEIKDPQELKQLNAFLNETEVINFSRQQAVQSTYNYVINLINRLQVKDQSLILKELSFIANEKDQVLEGKQQFSFFTFPKFSGVVLLIEQLKQTSQPIPIIFKMKIQCPEGNHTKLFISQGKDPFFNEWKGEEVKSFEELPVIVVEGFASPLEQPQKYFENREKCPSGFFSSVKKHENKKNTCSACQESQDNECSSLKTQKESFDKIKHLGCKILLAEGADFTRIIQKNFVDKYFCENPESPCPNLQKLFQEHQQIAIENGLSSDNGKTFVIEHVFADLGKYALSSKRLLDTRPEILLRDRAIL